MGREGPSESPCRGPLLVRVGKDGESHRGDMWGEKDAWRGVCGVWGHQFSTCVLRGGLQIGGMLL